MCIIYLRDGGVDIGYERFEASVINNQDGYGLCFPDYNGKLEVIRSADKADPEKLWRLISEELKDEDLMLHLRYTTCGETTLRNAHPFPILEKKTDGVDLRMAHNGTIGKYRPSKNLPDSDTRWFTREYLRPLFKRLIKGMDSEAILSDPFVEKVLENEIPSSSVLCLVDGLGNSKIINPKGNGGDFEEGLWYSNKYSFNKKHREPAQQSFTYGGTQAGKSTTSTRATSTVTPVFGDTNAPKFSDIMGIDPMDVAFMSDATLGRLMSEGTVSNRLAYAKELSYQVAKLTAERDAANMKIKLLEKKGIH